MVTAAIVNQKEKEEESFCLARTQPEYLEFPLIKMVNYILQWICPRSRRLYPNQNKSFMDLFKLQTKKLPARRAPFSDLFRSQQ